MASPLNCGAWDKKLLKQYRVHKPSSLSYEPEMRSKLTLKFLFLVDFINENYVGDQYYFKKFDYDRKEREEFIVVFVCCYLNVETRSG